MPIEPYFEIVNSVDSYNTLQTTTKLPVSPYLPTPISTVTSSLSQSPYNVIKSNIIPQNWIGTTSSAQTYWEYRNILTNNINPLSLQPSLRPFRYQQPIILKFKHLPKQD